MFPEFRRQIATVEEVLEGLLERPRTTVLVLNKMDAVKDADAAAGLTVEFPESFAVSARTGLGLDVLRRFMFAEAGERMGVNGHAHA